MAGGDLDQDDPDAVGIGDPHFGQAPGLGHRFPDDGYSGAGEPGVLGANVPDLDPDHHRAPGRAVRVPGDLEKPRAEEENHPGILRRAELPVDGQAQDVAVEPAAAAQVSGPHQDPAAQNFHATISSPHRVTQEAGRTRAGPVPAHPLDRLEWQKRAASVGSWRELSGHSDPGDPIGPEPVAAAPDARAAWHQALAALGPADGPEVRGMPDGRLLHLRDTYPVETAWAPRYVGDELRQVRAAAWDARLAALCANAEARAAQQHGDHGHAAAKRKLAAWLGRLVSAPPCRLDLAPSGAGAGIM